MIQKYGLQRVNEIAESYLRDQNAKMAKAVSEKDYSTGIMQWIGHNAGSVAANLVGSLTAPLGYMSEVATRSGRYSTLDPNNAGQLPGTYSAAVRQQTAENIEDRHGSFGSVIYQAGMSALDNLSRVLVASGAGNLAQAATGAEGLARAISEIGSLSLAATGSFGSAVKEYSQQGADPLMALGMGIVHGGIEVLTEKISLDNILDQMKDPKKAVTFLGEALKSGGVEVTEEEFGLLLRTLFEAGIMRENSSFNRRVAELQAYGLTSNQAKAQACYGVIEEAVMTAVQSFLSGGMMAAGSNAVTTAQNSYNQRQLEKTIKNAAADKMQQQTGKRGEANVTTDASVGEFVIEAAKRMSASVGRSIHLYSSEKGEDGFYDHKTGVLHINIKGADPVAQIVSHELTHSIESSVAYSDLSKLVLDRIRMTGSDLGKMRIEKAAQYEERGIKLDSKGVDQEIVASYIAHHLLTNESEITSLVRENPSLGEKIRNWLNDLLAKFGNSKAREKEFVRKARDAYAMALDQTRRTENVSNPDTTAAAPQGNQNVSNLDTTGQGTQENKNVPDSDTTSGADESGLRAQRANLQADFRAGRITQEEFEDAMDEILRDEEQIGIDSMRTEDRRFEAKNGESGRQYSITRTKNMDWKKQADSVLQKDGFITRSDTLVVDRISQFLKDDGIDDLPLAIPISIITKAKSGKDASHSIKNKNLRRLQNGIRNAAAIIDNPQRNAIVYITNIEQDGAPVLVSFSKNTLFDGDNVHKATSIHLQQDVRSLLNGLPADAKVYVTNENELNKWVGVTNNLRSLAANVEFINDIISQENAENNRQFSFPEDRGTIVDNQAQEQDQEGYEEVTLDRLNLPKGEYNRLEYAENSLMKEIARGMGIPYYADRSGLLAEIHDLSDWYLAGGTIEDDLMEDVFHALRNRSNQANQDFYDKYSGLQARIGDMCLMPSEEETDALNEFPDVVAKARRIMHGADAAGASVEALYKEAREMAPSLFRKSVSDPVAQLKQLINAWNNVQRSKASLDAANRGLTGIYEKTMRHDVQAALDKYLSTLHDVRDSAYEKIERQRARADEQARQSQNQNESPTHETIPASDSPDETVLESDSSDIASSSQNVTAQMPSAASIRELKREKLNTKAINKLRHEETVLLNHLGQALGVPRYAKKDILKPLIQEMTDEYLRTGMISKETKTRVVEAAYKAGILIDREFYDQYKHIKEQLRTTAITLSQQYRLDVPDYGRLRRNANRHKLLRITEDGGQSVESFYQEMREMAPELFPAELTYPADQLQRLFEIAQDIVIAEISLNDYHGPLADEYKAGALADFEEQLTKSFPALSKIRRYGEDKLLDREDKPITVEEAEEISQKVKLARREYEKVNAKHLLTEHDEMQVGRLLRGETQLEYLQNEENFGSIKAVFEAKKKYEEYAQLLNQYKKQVRKKHLDLADHYLETAMSWKDKKSGILYSRETMRRNIFDIVPDPDVALQIIEEYFEPVHHSEALATRFKQEYRDRVKDLNLSRKVEKGNLVSEAHAVQLLGEALDNIRLLENARGRMKTRDGKTLPEWQAVVQDLWLENPNLNQSKVESAVREFRKIYDEVFQKMNRARLENGYEPVNYRQGYFPHFQPGDGDGVMAYFGRILGIDVNVEALPTTINGLTHTFKPGIQWFGNAQERLGFNTAYDALEGFDKYIEGVASVIYHTENIQKLRALGTQVRYRTSDEGIRDRVDAIRRKPNLGDEERESLIREIYEHGRFELANFAAELDEYTNLLANKKSKYDRSMEAAMGRKAYTVMKRAESAVGANMIAANLSSAFTNFIPLTQAVGRIGVADMSRGIRDTALAVLHKDQSIVCMSDFLTNRRGGDVLVKNWQDKLSNVLGAPMELIDNIVSESIVRAGYHQQKRAGLSDAEAMHQADVLASSIMADRSKGAMPTLFEASNPIAKLFTQFQLEVNNQYSELFKDLPRAYKEKGLAALGFALAKYFIAAWLWNGFEEKIKGRRSALDPIDALDNFFTDLRDAGIGEAGSNLVVSALEDLPFSSALNVVGFELDGGRVPVASAIPDFGKAWNALTGKDLTRQQRKKDFFEEFQKPITYLLMPAGGNQLAKAWKGIQAYRAGGSYSLDREGKEILQYPIYKDTPQERTANLWQSVLFGKSATSGAQEWVANDFDSLNAEETVVYKDLLDAGAKSRTAYEALREVQAVPYDKETHGDNAGEMKRQEQVKIILDHSELGDQERAILFYGLASTQSERDLMDKLVEAGAEYDGMVKFVSDFSGIKHSQEDNKHQAYRQLLSAYALTEEEKDVVMGEILGTEETTETGGLSVYGKYKLAAQSGMTVDDFMAISEASKSTGSNMDRYFDITGAGIRKEDAVKLVVAMAELEPLPGEKSVTWYQRCDVILDSRLSERDQVRALQTVCNENTGAKVQIGYDNGLPPGALIHLKQLLPQFDENSNGSYSQKEVTAAIDAVCGDDNFIYAMTGTTPHGFRLSNEQKAVLWQLQTGAKNGKGNPYSVTIGKEIYDLVQADKAAREEE